MPAAHRDKLRPYINSTGQIRNDTARQLLAEFFGTLLFQMFGGSAPARDTTAPAANGFALVALSECSSCLIYGHSGTCIPLPVSLPSWVGPVYTSMIFRVHHLKRINAAW